MGIFILFNLFNKCQFDLVLKEKSYNGLLKKLFDLNFIKNVNNFFIYLLENYSKYTFKNKKLLKEIDYKFTKKLLTMLLIVKFPNIAFNNNTEYNEQIIDISTKIYNLIEKIVHSPSNKLLFSIKLIDHIHKYMNIYSIWSMIDKRINTYIILQMYYKNTIRKLELPKESRLYEILTNSIDNDQNELVNSIKYMNDENEAKFFNYYKENLDYNKTIEEKLYLIELKYRLSKTPPDNLIFVELVDKTKNMLKNCVPNRKDHHEIIDNVLDTDLMTTYINNGIIDNNYFYNIIHIIIDKVKEYQAKADDQELEEFRNKCNDKLDNREFYRNFIPMFFIEVYKRLDGIITARETFIRFINKK